MKRPKYGNRKKDGFDSVAEAKRAGDLIMLQRAGQIANLERQVRFNLLESVMYDGAARATGPMWYTADFQYDDLRTGKTVTEDVKGFADDVFKVKRHMMKALLGIDITIPGAKPYGAPKAVKVKKAVRA